VQLTQTNFSYPQWPASLRTQHFTVTVEFVVGKDGHVVSARGVSGPPEAYRGCEDAVRKMTFRPYLVLDTPVEVEQKTSCKNN
jgi:outer membrane biosynthesis protein TonB